MMLFSHLAKKSSNELFQSRNIRDRRTGLPPRGCGSVCKFIAHAA
jgi:hypothetical protein